jgi:hypothetical protein
LTNFHDLHMMAKSDAADGCGIVGTGSWAVVDSKRTIQRHLLVPIGFTAWNVSFTECLVGICTISGGKIIVVRERLTALAGQH